MLSKINNLLLENKITKNQTPIFIFSNEKLIENFNYFKQKLNLNSENIFYSVKSNYASQILLQLDKLNSGFEIASIYELELLISLNISTHKVIFSNPIKIPEQIKTAYENGVKIFAYDCESELKKISLNAANSNVYLRINISNIGADWSLNEKFGANLEDSINLLQKAQNYGLKAIGITFHNGWNNQNIETWIDNIKIAKSIIEKSFDLGLKLEFINLGGGFPAHNVEQYQLLDKISEQINPYLNQLKNNINIKIYTEPGTFIVNNIGGLIVEVYDIINRNHQNWAFINSGIMQGFAWILSGLYYQVYCLRNHQNFETKKFIVTGPTNDSKDIFGTFNLPKDLQIGDLLFIYPAAAYTFSSQKYNGYSIPDYLCF